MSKVQVENPDTEILEVSFKMHQGLRIKITSQITDMLQNHAGQMPILIGIPYPVVYEIPVRNYRPRPMPPIPRQEPMANLDYQDYPDIVSDDVFEGPAWMKQ